MSNEKVVYIGMVADLFHHGHLNLIKTASGYGKLIVGILTDEAVESYKRTPIISFENRKKIVESIKYVDEVVEQNTSDYTTNLLKYKPDFVLHGDDWLKGVLSPVRDNIIKVISQWGGQVIDVPYTSDISTTTLIHSIKNKAF